MTSKAVRNSIQGIRQRGKDLFTFTQTVNMTLTSTKTFPYLVEQSSLKLCYRISRDL